MHVRIRVLRATTVLVFLAAAFASPGAAIDDHLLLCEAVVTPTANEFVEIANPTAAAVALDDYYLSDDENYALLPGFFGAGPAPVIAASDFIARFPAGATIPPAGVVVVAFDGAGFLATFGFAADFEIAGTDAGTPDMVAAYAGSIGSTAGLTNAGESAVLFTWDGASDLVSDVDMLNIGTPSTANDIADKTGVAVDGPDADAVATAYLFDLFTMPQQAADPGGGASTKRLFLEAGSETAGGGNGATGDDETSEQITTTWDGPAFGAPNPGVCDVLPLVPQFVINEIHADPDATAGDANGDGTASTTQDEFVELVNVTGAPVDISGWTVSDGFGVRHTFPGGTIVPDQCGVVVFAGGTPTGAFGGMTVQTASTNALGLNNGGDTVTLNDGSSDVATASYGPEGGDNQSLTLDPDLTGPAFVKHSTATGSGGALFSPGTKIDGSKFSGCPTPVTGWVINEIHADPDSTNGDANGDGTAQFSDDEFVEIINATGAAVDISGWTLADGFGVRHTFPGGTVVPDQCGVVVFGGGTPTGDFGNVTVQTASSNALGLNNGGDTVTLNDGFGDQATASYGSEGGDNQSLTLDPDVTGPAFVKHAGATGSGGALFSPGTKIDGSQFFGCPVIFSGWVINEIHADPDSTNGDANGDGTAQFSQDEFVEIVNVTGADVDMSNWTLADGFTVRHTFPPGTVVKDQCGIVVFGGGSPTGLFGNMVVQTASGGSLGLNNGGDTVTLNDGFGDQAMATYGSEGGDNQSLTLDPDVSGPAFVKHSAATGSGGALYSPGTKIDGSQFSGCDVIPVLAEIFEIQGGGAVSPLAGALVTTEDNVVTAVGVDGFFIQTPTSRTDGLVDTSDGIFVFTGGPPAVAVGDLVDVTGGVQEFFGFTELGFGPTVTVVGTEAPPAPVLFDATVPSPSPTSPSCAIEYECYEGMLIEIVDGTVTGPNQRFGPDPVAEVHVTAASARTFREPGIEFPGLAGLPEWDGNPEVFELDPDKLGLANQIIPAGSTFSATGALGFEFGGYELWPSSLTVVPAPLPVPVRPRAPGEFTVGTLNVFRLFDDVDDPPDGDRDDIVVSAAEYARRLAKLSAYIREVLRSPDVLAVEEAEKLGVLEDLAAKIETDDPGVVYSAFLVEGNDVGTIDVGFLVRDGIAVDAVVQLGKDELLSVDGSLLHDRPPLLLVGSCQLEFGSYPIAVMAVHNRSLGGIDSPSDGPRVRQKRYEQALSIVDKVEALKLADPDVRLVVIGDFNAFEFTDGYVDAVGVISGTFDPADNLVCETNDCFLVPDTGLFDEILGLAADERYSFIFAGSAQVLDHALTSAGLQAEVAGAEFGRGNADAAVDLINDDGSVEPANLPLRSSDHDGLVVYITKDADDDGVPNDLDVCPGTAIPEDVPTQDLGVNRWALVDDDGIFDTTPPPGGGGGPGLAFTLGDTAGCSCEQIIDALHLGEGHVQHGCSNGAMTHWVDLVNP
ncbi:MAG: lamin tail domain-containing protein [Acidobacteriota bacterium]|nr:lamin tail domain-containing protein [Acidobacteriota bacterium]MDH3522753.1 lamin tail domain-containing protein [Acidobacteriota bacterium]